MAPAIIKALSKRNPARMGFSLRVRVIERPGIEMLAQTGGRRHVGPGGPRAHGLVGHYPCRARARTAKTRLTVGANVGALSGAAEHRLQLRAVANHRERD